jgi:hypothetical protein
MPITSCPLCGASIDIPQEDAILFSRICCPECDLLLEITSEDPLMVDPVFDGRWDYEDSYSEDLSQNRRYVKRAKRSTEHERARKSQNP